MVANAKPRKGDKGTKLNSEKIGPRNETLQGGEECRRIKDGMHPDFG
jgi:hypothetical protein